MQEETFSLPSATKGSSCEDTIPSALAGGWDDPAASVRLVPNEPHGAGGGTGLREAPGLVCVCVSVMNHRLSHAAAIKQYRRTGRLAAQTSASGTPR